MDEWFQTLGQSHPQLGYFLVLTDGRVILALCGVVVVAAAFQRRWTLAAATAITPVLAVMAARLAKRSFGRLKDGELCYPSGHTTLAFVVLAMAVLLVGAATWAIVTFTAIMVLAVIGQAVTYHYFTDAIGALFLGSAFVCMAVWAAGLDRCQPQGDVDHSPR